MKVMITLDSPKRINKAEQNSLFIQFPYNIDIVGEIRKYHNRFWDANTKTWEISEKELTSFLAFLTDKNIEVEVINAERLKTASKIELPNNARFKTIPYSYQLDGVKYGLENDCFILADEQGLGKTKQVIDTAVFRKEAGQVKKCLIICGVNGLKYNWKKEIEIHSNEKAHIIGDNGKQYFSNTDKLNDLTNIDNIDAYFLITNIETFRNEEIAVKIKELCNTGVIGMIAFDEMHRSKNPSSQQAKGMLKATAPYKIAMTGTPIMNKPLDTYIILKWLGDERKSYYSFQNHYCVKGGYGGHEIIGYKNMAELKARLDRVMLRRLKSEVLDLPEKIRTTEYLEMEKDQYKVYKRVFTDTLNELDKIKLSPNPLSMLLRLRQVTSAPNIVTKEVISSIKLERCKQLVDDMVENGEKVIIYSNWVEVLNIYIQELKKYNPAVITGELKTTERKNEIDRFMNDDSCKVIIGTIGAMGTGYTLTAASNIIFLDSPWTWAEKVQAEDRGHRIGQKQNLNVITLVVRGTVDERVEDIINKKKMTADLLVDGITPEYIGKSEIMEYIDEIFSQRLD